MKFIKMQGAGNDYIYVDCLHENVPDPVELARRVSDRRFGIGGDGLVLICRSDVANLRMDIYNSDGSRAKMCGNASRCVGKYAYEHGLIGGERSLTLETLSGIRKIELELTGKTVSRVRVNMGAPVFAGRSIPTVFDESRIIRKRVSVGGREYAVTCLSMGNPHCVVFDDDPAALPLSEIGPCFEKSPMFPEGVNTEFVKVIDRRNILMRVWERGSGETLACGTGACAAAVACAECGQTGREVRVHLRGGLLDIDYTDSGEIYMTGPAEEVFTVEIPYNEVMSWSYGTMF